MIGDKERVGIGMGGGFLSIECIGDYAGCIKSITKTVLKLY
jgi:hypothetical protein